MNNLKGSSWQQRYNACEIYTLRCKITDQPGMFARLLTALGQTGAQLGEIVQVDLDGPCKIRDITVFLSDAQQLVSLEQNIQTLEGVEILSKRDEIMEIHRRGAINVVSRVPLRSQTDLRMVYTPGVAAVCQHLVQKPQEAPQWTGLGDRIAIVTNGTAVLGLGDIGPVAGLPVMEGKAAILSEFVDVSGVPILIESKEPQVIVDTVLRIAPSFGAIQLEDIAAPACFEIEEQLKAKLNIPVFHDDQHGTATVVLAALINAMKMTRRRPADCKVVMLGAGAAGLAVSKILLGYGLGDIMLYDTKGPIYRGRTENMNRFKEELAQITNKKNLNVPLAQGFKQADIFIGLSRPNMVGPDMIRAMNPDPIVFPLGNPVGEIDNDEARRAGAAVVADGREINNALAYPGIFRGALDARARDINMTMKVAAAQCLAELAPGDQLLPDILNRDNHVKVAQAVANAWKD